MTGFLMGDRMLDAFGDVHPAWMMAYAEVGPYLVVGGSAIGQIHLAQQLHRDDAFVIRSLGPWLAVGMSDGVGTYPLSRYGATYTAEELAASLLRPFAPQVKAEKTETDLRHLSSPSSSVPPPKVEEVEFKFWSEGLLEWEKTIHKDTDSLPLQKSQMLPSQKLHQVASLGWFLPAPASTLFTLHNQGTRSTSQSSHRPITASPLDQKAEQGELQATSNEPDTTKIMQEAFRRSFMGLRERAKNWRLELADLSCTALALLLNVETGRGVVGQVGDGALLGLTTQGNVEKLAFAPQTDDSQSVYVLSSPNFEKYLDVKPINHPEEDPFVAFYVMSDGVSIDLLYSPEPENLKSWARAVDRNLRASGSPAQAAAGMLNWLATYQVKGSWDDRTLVVITQKDRSSDNR